MSNSHLETAALKAISEEVDKLLIMSLPVNVQVVIERIASIARYQFDVRTDEEQKASQT